MNSTIHNFSQHNLLAPSRWCKNTETCRSNFNINSICSCRCGDEHQLHLFVLQVQIVQWITLSGRAWLKVCPLTCKYDLDWQVWWYNVSHAHPELSIWRRTDTWWLTIYFKIFPLRSILTFSLSSFPLQSNAVLLKHLHTQHGGHGSADVKLS